MGSEKFSKPFTDSVDLIASEGLYQRNRALKAKAQSPLILRRVLGIIKRP